MFQIKIRVQGGKYILVQVNRKTETPIKDWKKYAADARAAVMEQTGTALHEGLYPCPMDLLRKLEADRLAAAQAL